MITFPPHTNFRTQALLSPFLMGRLSTITQLVGGEAGLHPFHLAPGLLPSPPYHTIFWKSICPDDRCLDARSAVRKEGAALPKPAFLSPSWNSALIIILPIVLSPEVPLEAQCHSLPSFGNNLCVHFSRKFCLWKFLNMIFTHNI